MNILFDRNTEPRYINAIATEPWANTEFADDHLSQTASDPKLAQYAETNDMVLFTRDADFFKLVRDQYDCGLLYFRKGKRTTPGDIVLAVERIRDAYANHDNIEEGLPGNWV
ncbi:MAG: DUF5615 family PIN-like protein [Haloarculaceae archaeon]